jgi:hypothetical protein
MEALINTLEDFIKSNTTWSPTPVELIVSGTKISINTKSMAPQLSKLDLYQLYEVFNRFCIVMARSDPHFHIGVKAVIRAFKAVGFPPKFTYADSMLSVRLAEVTVERNKYKSALDECKLGLDKCKLGLVECTSALNDMRINLDNISH